MNLNEKEGWIDLAENKHVSKSYNKSIKWALFSIF